MKNKTNKETLRKYLSVIKNKMLLEMKSNVENERAEDVLGEIDYVEDEIKKMMEYWYDLNARYYHYKQDLDILSWHREKIINNMITIMDEIIDKKQHRTIIKKSRARSIYDLVLNSKIHRC